MSELTLESLARRLEEVEQGKLESKGNWSQFI